MPATATRQPGGMRIGFDIRGAQQQSSVERGIGRYIFDLIDGLSQFAPEDEYILLTQPDLAISTRFGSLPACCRTVSVPTRHLGHLARLGNRRDLDKLKPVWWYRCHENQGANANALRDTIAREKLDLLHLTDNLSQTYFTSGRYPCPVVKTFYDATPLILKDRYMANWPDQVNSVYLAELAAIRQADRVVAISRSAAEDAVRLLEVPSEKVSVIYPAIHDSFRPIVENEGARACRAGYGIVGRYFINCSGAGENKNRDGCVRAFARLAASHPDGASLQFVLVGPHGNDEAQLETIAREAGLTDGQFLITGFVPDDDLVTLFSGAIGLVAASFYEGFGLPPAQALQVGTPAIVANRGGLPEVVGDAGLLVDPYDIEGIARAMARLLDEPHLRAELAALGHKHVAQFTTERQAEGHICLYRELAQRERVPK